MANLLESLSTSLPMRQRLALSYTGGKARTAILLLLAFDARMAGIVRNSHEPMLAQIRLAWWRELLAQDASLWPKGEPLLAALSDWPGERGTLVELASAWEAMAGSAPLPSSAIEGLANARAGAFAALDGRKPGDTRRMARNWALLDIASHLSDPRERDAALSLAQASDWTPARLDRSLRPLAVLHALALSDLRRGDFPDRVSPRALLVAMRTGMFGF